MRDQDFTIVEPSAEVLLPTDDYMSFLERCTRTCYKSEDRICEGSAEKLLSKVVKGYKHLSVTEHANCIIDIVLADVTEVLQPAKTLALILNAGIIGHKHAVALFSSRASSPDSSTLRLSGNIRMWRELIDSPISEELRCILQGSLNKCWPFFFEDDGARPKNNSRTYLQLSNPLACEVSHEERIKHCTLTVKIVCDRTTSHQLVRHRMGSYSQESQRYCNYGKKGFQFIVPHALRFNTIAKTYFIDSARQSYSEYTALLKLGVKPEDARGVLPGCTKTELMVTYTLDMWKHFFKHRGHNKKAQHQIRHLALDIERQFSELMPNLFPSVVEV